MPPKRYRSRAAAERAATRVKRDVPQAHVEVNFDNSLSVYVYTAALTPGERRAIEEHDVQEPKAPSPKTPLLERRTRPAVLEPSTVAEPGKVCREVFARYLADGRLDDRKAAIEEAIAAGVTPNTAKTIYYVFRGEVGLPRSVRRARASRRSPVKLKATPTAVRVCNGVAEPALGTKAREVWDVADALHAKFRRPPKRGEVGRQIADVSPETLKRSYVAWRKFHAIPRQGQYHERGTS